MINTPDFIQRPNPITEQYYILTRDIDDNIAKDLRPNAEENEKIKAIISLPDF